MVNVHAQQLTDQKIATLDSLFSPWNSNNKPGLAVAIVKDQTTLYTKTAGLADVNDKKPIDLKTEFWIASVSKQFTALAISILEQDGRLSLEDPMVKYMPEMKRFPNVKIKHLLHHTSGLRDGYTLVGMTLRGEKHYDAHSVLQMMQRQQELNFIPGSRFEYVNSNYVLLALIIERISGKPYAAFMKENVFSTLGMANARVFNKKDNPTDAKGYYETGGRYKEIKSFLPAIGSTGVMLSLEDAITFEKKFHSSTPPVSLLLQNDDEENDNQYRRGVEAYELKGKFVVSHFGSDPGFRADIVRVPEEKLSVIIFSNAGNYWDLAKNTFDVAGIVLSEPNFITHWYKPEELRSDSIRGNGLTGIYLDTISGSSLRFIKYDNGTLKASTQLHGYYAPLKEEQPTVYTKQDVYEYAYKFDGQQLTVKRADGTFILNKLATPDRIQPSLKGRYHSAELGKTYRITSKGGKLRLTFLRAIHSPLTPIAENVYYTEFSGGNVLRFSEHKGKVILLFSRDGIKNLKFVKK